MDTSRLTDQEYEVVARWRQLMGVPGVYTRMWVEGYRNLFNPDSYLPMQMVKFYAIIDREIVEYQFVCDTPTISFNEFKNRIIEGCRGNNIELIGPYVPKDSSVKELVDIIKFYEDHHYIKFNETPHGHQDNGPVDHTKATPVKPTNQNRDTVSNLI